MTVIGKNFDVQGALQYFLKYIGSWTCCWRQVVPTNPGANSPPCLTRDAQIWRSSRSKHVLIGGSVAKPDLTNDGSKYGQACHDDGKVAVQLTTPCARLLLAPK